MEWVREGPRGCGGSSPEMAVTRPPRSPLQDRLEVWLKKKESAPARERSFSTSNHPPLTSGVGLAIRPERPYKHRQRLLAGHPPALTRHHLRHPLQRVQLAVLLSTVLLESLRRPHCHASLIAALLNAYAPAIREDSVYSPFAPHPQQARAAAPFAWSRVPHLLVDAIGIPSRHASMLELRYEHAGASGTAGEAASVAAFQVLPPALIHSVRPFGSTRPYGSCLCPGPGVLESPTRWLY